MHNTPLILSIKGNSLDDGPGIRSVVFFKGCPLSCVWCHNPESKKASPEISYDSSECVGCDTCIDLCPNNALSRENPLFIDRNLCDLCYACVDECPSGALARVGTEMTVNGIAAEIIKDKPFYDTSGGGATLSGGEPTLFMDFLSELLRRLKQKGIHTLVETCGHFDLDRFVNKVLPYVDTLYYDIKLLDAGAHKRFCGISNETILKNFVRLNELAAKEGLEILPRTPLVPNITATEENLKAIADFLTDHGIHQARLLPYNPLWHEKSCKIGVAGELQQDADMAAWMPQEKIKNYETIFKDRGISL